MKAIVYETCGSPDVARCEEIEKPRVRDHHVLIRVRAAPWGWCARSAPIACLTTLNWIFTRAGEKYDLIFDCVSNHSLSDYRRVLRPKGVLVMAGDQTVRGAFGIVGRLTVALVLSTHQPDIRQIPGEAQAGRLVRSPRFDESRKDHPVVDKVLQPEPGSGAIRYLEQKRARGKVVITVA